MKKKIIQNLALSAILLTALAVPTVMGAMEKKEVDFKGFGEALQNDGGDGLPDKRATLGEVDDSVTSQPLEELEIANANQLINIVCASNVTNEEKIKKLEYALKNAGGWTLLHLACFQNNLEIVKYLVEYGKADVKAKAQNHQTPRDKATDPQVKAYLEMAEDFYAVNNKQMTFDAFAKKHLINTTKVEYTDADELLEKIATVELNDQKFKVIKSYLTYVDQNFETDNKLAVFAEYANKYTVTGNELRVNNVADTYHLLHLGTKAFFDDFVGFAEQHKLLNFGDGAEKEFILFDCATRKGLHRDAWFKECCSLLGKKTDNPFEKTSEFELTFNKALRKLPIKKRDRLTKEKNKIVQLKKNLETLPTALKNKNVNNPYPWAAGKFNDLEFKFKN